MMITSHKPHKNLPLLLKEKEKDLSFKECPKCKSQNKKD